MSEQNRNEPARILQLYETMCLIRAFEERAEEAFDAGLVNGSIHQYIGQEAVGTGVCANLRDTDYILSNHRGHGHSIAKGADPEAMMKELMGRVGGTSGAKGGSMHIADFSVGMLGANGVLADGLTMGVGAAQAIALKGEDAIVAVFVGDGTTNRGPFYEALNWAMVYELPILFVCENNTYASSTLTRSVTAGEGPVARAQAFGMPTFDVDGNDLVAVDAVAAEAIGAVRGGKGPQFLHARTYRVKGHISRDKLLYRAEGETEENWKREPLGACAAWLAEEGIAEDDIAAARDAAYARIDAAVEAAKAAPFPDASLAYQDVQDLGPPEIWPENLRMPGGAS
ncbi:MAG: thiamine pyrophosphate-dependent dehydrogenase E1 component subunit alpha [Alphaproteobacteria bacterium]|nr:thiamine pyrophosphate-dependent dehydrogenase E1 component subunit alpha [Alphaproteobacteria bacterium]